MNDNKSGEEPSLDLSFSLLWPKGTRSDTAEIHEQSATDLGLQKIVDFMAFDQRHRDALGTIIRSLCLDPGTIDYRLDIIDELARFPELVRCIESLLPVLRDLKYYETFLALEWKTSLQEAIWRLRQLEGGSLSVGDSPGRRPVEWAMSFQSRSWVSMARAHFAGCRIAFLAAKFWSRPMSSGRGTPRTSS